jgi:hypothetical protein
LDVSVPNQAGTASLERAIIEVPLEPPLPPGSSTRVSINYNVSVPRQSGRLGLTSQSIMLGNWFATLGVHRGDWDRRPYTDVGDAFFTEVADFQLEIDTVQPMELAFTGTLVQRIGNHWSIRAENVRDVALVGSSHFTIAQTNVGGITVSAYTLSTDPARLSATAAEMVEWYSARFGAYPYAQLRALFPLRAALTRLCLRSSGCP